MTSRLITLTVISFLLLLGLLFALGFQLGLQWGSEEANAQFRAGTATVRPAPIGSAVSVAVPATTAVVPSAAGAMATVPAVPTGVSVTPR